MMLGNNLTKQSKISRATMYELKADGWCCHRPCVSGTVVAQKSLGVR
jgi:hypothetical protein